MSFHAVNFVLSSNKLLCRQLSDTIPTHVSPRTEILGPVFQIELFHDQLPLAVPCYDLVPVTELTLGPTYVEISGTPGSLDLTGGEYKT